MITEPKIEDRNDQHYVGIRTQVTMQELGKLLPPLWGEVYGWLANKGRIIPDWHGARETFPRRSTDAAPCIPRSGSRPK
jgi:hypothetical protein